MVATAGDRARGLVGALAIAAGAGACGGAAKAVERTTPGVGVTVYSAPEQTGDVAPGAVFVDEMGVTRRYAPGYAVVKEWRKVRIDERRATLRFTDVAAQIDATTVHFRSVTDPKGTTVLEQNFEYDLVSADKILEKHLDRPITLVSKSGGEVRGRLLSFDAAQIVVETGDATNPLQVVQRAKDVRTIRFGALPEGLITKPTLTWRLDAAKLGEQLVKVTYQTEGLAWNADYTVVIAKDERTLDLGGWVTITNASGATYTDAELKLVAGDVHRAPRPRPRAMRELSSSETRAKGAARREGFVEKSFFEYHLYTLGRSTTIPDNSVKQIELFEPRLGAPTKKILVYAGGLDRPWSGGPHRDRDLGQLAQKKVDVYLELENDKASGLGLPLPAGRLRVYKKDESDGSLELVGEDRIQHTPKDETIRLRLGSAFDVVGERRQVDFHLDEDKRELVEKIEVRVRNHKDEDVEVIVREKMYRWINWKIVEPSHPASKQDARTVHFPIRVPKNGETVVTYTARYTW